MFGNNQNTTALVHTSHKRHTIILKGFPCVIDCYGHVDFECFEHVLIYCILILALGITLSRDRFLACIFLIMYAVLLASHSDIPQEKGIFSHKCRLHM